MLSIAPGRRPTPYRINNGVTQAPDIQVAHYQAPVQGLVTNFSPDEKIAKSAALLENFWPTATGISPRGGTVLRATTGELVKGLFAYTAGNSPQYFASGGGNIYQFDGNGSGEALTPIITGQHNDNYSTIEMTTDGGTFLIVVNGEDHMQIYDGEVWQAVSNVSSPFVVTGGNTQRFAQVWLYRNRLFFVDRRKLEAWYLDINSVAGEAYKLPLGGIFRNGGRLLFGATISSDSGAGMDDRCAFVTDRGEVAVYNGGDPSSLNDWSLDGVYNIGEPISKNAHIQIGGDLAIATKGGLVPLSAAFNKDPAQLELAAISRNIGDLWRRLIQFGEIKPEWGLVRWTNKDMAIVAPFHPDEGVLALNLETGAWGTFPSWDITALVVAGDRLFLGDRDGNILEGDIGGLDNGQTFECRACFRFDDMGHPTSLKNAHFVKGIWRNRSPCEPEYSVATNYIPEFDVIEEAANWTDKDTGQWDISLWDTKLWAEGDTPIDIHRNHMIVSGLGYVLAPQVQIISNVSNRLNCELVSLDLGYSAGRNII